MALSDREGGLIFDAGNQNVGEYMDRWLNDSLRDTVRQSTLVRYEQLVRLHISPALGRIALKSLSAAHVQGFYRDRLDSGLSPATVQKIHAVLHKVLDQAASWSLVPRNPTESVKAPRPAPEEIRPLNREQAKALLETARRERFEALYVLAVTTGLRQGELLGLKWEDVDLENSLIRVRRTLIRNRGRLLLGEPKTKRSRRTVRLTEAAVQALKEHLARQIEQMERLGDLYEDQGLIFATQRGTLVNPTNLRKRSFAPLLEKAGLLPIRFHDLRHTCATLLLSRNVNPKIGSEMLGTPPLPLPSTPTPTYCPPCKIARPAPLRTRCGRADCSTVAVRSPGCSPGLLCVLCVSPANTCFFRVEPRGFEPLTSAVQSQIHNVVVVRRCSEIPAKSRIYLWKHSWCSPLFVWVGVLLVYLVACVPAFLSFRFSSHSSHRPLFSCNPPPSSSERAAWRPLSETFRVSPHTPRRHRRGRSERKGRGSLSSSH